MPDCEEAIYSNDYFDFIVEKQFMDELEGEDEYCVQTLNENYEAVGRQRDYAGARSAESGIDRAGRFDRIC